MGSGKLDDRQEVHTLSARDSNLVFLKDLLSGRRFLVDSQFFHRLLQFHLFLRTKLLTAGGSPLPCFGARSLLLRFGSCRFSWSFQLAPVSVPILGSDLLHHHALLVDIARARVLDADSLDVLSAVSSPATSDPFYAHLQQAPREI